MTLSIASPGRQRLRRVGISVSAMVVAASLGCAAHGQEPAPEPPAQEAPMEEPPVVEPEEPVPLPPTPELMPDPEIPLLPDGEFSLYPLPAGLAPIRERRRPAANDWWEAETQPPAPVTEAPQPILIESESEFSGDSAMGQALSTGETFLGSLGGLGSNFTSPFLAEAPIQPMTGSGTPLARPLRLGLFDVNLYASAGVLGTHFSGQLGDQFSTTGLFQAGLAGKLGNGLTTISLRYNIGGGYPEDPAQALQSGQTGGGSLDQQVSLRAKFSFPEIKKVEFFFGASYARLSGIDRDVGSSARRQIATAQLGVNWQYSDKTSLGLNVSVPVRQFSDAVSSSGIASSLFADTKVSRKTTLGLGYTFGALAVDEGSDQIYHQAFLRANFAPTRFLRLNATAGVDLRDRGDFSDVAPIFGLSTSWDSGQGTLVTLAAERRIFNAASAINTNFTSTSIVLSAFQRFGRRVIGSLSLGYEYTDYQSLADGLDTERVDKVYYFSAGVLVPLALHWDCSLAVQAGKKESEFEEFDFVQSTFKTTLSF